MLYFFGFAIVLVFSHFEVLCIVLIGPIRLKFQVDALIDVQAKPRG